MKSLNEEMLALGRAKYQEASGLADMERDKDGFILLKPTAKRVDDTMVSLSANIGSLEAKLKRYKEEQQKTKKIMDTPEYKESKKELSKKKQKKKRDSLLIQIFNNADAISDDDEEEEDEEDGTYRDSRKGKAKAKKDAGNTLDTTYGKRFSPVVSMLYDTIADFDKIASDIEADLKSSRNSARTMYRSSQIGNMISAKNSKLSAVKELNAVAKTISDLEYKKEKDKKAEEGSDSNKAVASMAARILRGGLDEIDASSSKKGKKGKKDKKDSSYNSKSAFSISRGLGRSVLDEKDDDDDSFGSIKRSSKGGGSSEQEQRELASEFANALLKNKDKIKFTAHEKHIDLEGTYTTMVLCDPLDTSDYKFVAVDKKGKILNDDVYKELLPKKKKCRLKFDISKNRATDLNSARTYKLMYKD